MGIAVTICPYLDHKCDTHAQCTCCVVKEVNNMQPTMIVDVTCVSCSRNYRLLVPVEGYNNWARRKLHIQDAMPGLSAAERELLISNICPDCWDRMFKNEE